MEIKVRFTEPRRRQRMAIMVTREPHCFEKILGAIKPGALRRPIRPWCSSTAATWSRWRGNARLPFVHVPWEDRLKAEQRALRVLDEHEIDFIVLARFMKILSPNFVWRFKNKIINIHPSLLPSFPGPQAYRQAYEQGVKIIGVSAHFVTHEPRRRTDHRPGLLRGPPPDALKEIVAAGQKLEAHRSKAVKLYLDKRLDVYWGIVKEV